MKYKTRQYLDVPYHDKKCAKSLGALWDPDLKSWYSKTTRLGLLVRYTREITRVYFHSEYQDKEFIKNLKCYYDFKRVKWYTYNIYLDEVRAKMTSNGLKFDVIQ